MIRNQLILPLHHKLVIDYFAGGGGASTGIELALGRCVDHAVNHDAKALGMHRINHPQTVHWCSDVFEVNPWELTKGQPVGLIHFSPDCKHFSKAKGGQPLNKKIRGLVLVMLKWAKYGAECMTMENVEEIVTWGPINRKGYAIKRHKGRTWKAFLDCLSVGIRADHPDLPEILAVVGDSVTKEDLVRGFGYHYEAREIRAKHHDTPTIRKRLYMVARNDGRPIAWPAITNDNVREPKVYQGQRILPFRMIAECIDWDLQCHSIFMTQAQAKRRGLNVKRPLVRSTLQRVATGIDRFVLKAAEPFIVSLTHQGGDRVESIMEPARAITGARRGEKALVAPILTEHANASKQRTFRADEPMRTQCGEVKGGHFALVSGVLVGSGGPTYSGKPKSVAAPMNAQTTENHAAVAMVKLRGTNIGDKVSAPMHTASAGGQHHGLVAATLVRHFGESIGQGVSEPAPTVMPDGQGKTGVVACYMAQHNGGENGNQAPSRPLSAPLSTITGRGTQQQLVAVSAVGFHKSCQHGQAVNRPSNAATTKPRLGLVESTLAYGLTPAELAGARRVARFLRAFGVKFEGDFATVQGRVMVDIGMRMLTPRELFRAQGFPEEYVIDRAWIVDPNTAHHGRIREVKLTKEEQIRMCGNSVCPKVMRDIVQVNVPYLSAWFPEERKRVRRRVAVAA